MGAGKVFCILAGIITLISTFFLSLFSVVPSAYLWLDANTAYGSGLGFFLHIADIFANVDTMAADLGIESYLIYIFAGMLILWGISGILMGTHMDAPWHYHPTSQGKESKTIDEIPIEYYYNDGVVLDMTHIKLGELINSKDIQKVLKKIKYEQKPLDIVLIRTDTDKFWDTFKYWTDYAGVGREGTIWLVDQGIKVVGTDAPGWDRPFHVQAQEFRETGNKNLIWEGHYAGIEREYYQMEKLTNLDQLPPYGFKVSYFPIKILKASAAWVRPVAIIEIND